MPHLTWIDDPGAATADAGGKGASLARLTAAGFRVPPAFVIFPDAAHAIAAGGAPEAAAAVTAAATRLLAEGPVAVRSSAQDEDSAEASFAGQHLTVLDVTSVEGVLNAVAACVASLQSEGAAAYRAARAAEGDARMAVVVQRMVAAEAAGVAFSIDPVSGDTTRAVVEAVAGTGEALVSGVAEADRMILERPGLRVIERHHPGTPVLDEAMAHEAARQAMRAEELFGAPQDIEFAFEGGLLWMLQSRPITVAGAPAAEGGWVSEFDTVTTLDDHWTSANVQEVLPGLLTPLSMTMFADAAIVAYNDGYRRLKMLRQDENPRFVGMFYNRAYLNISATRMIADRVLGSSGDAIEHRFLGGEYTGKPKTVHSRELWGFRLRSAVPGVRMLVRIHHEGDRIERETMAWQRRVRADDVAAMSGPEIEGRRKALSAFVARIFQVHLQASGVAGSGFDSVAGMVLPILGDETEGRVPALFSGMHGVESAQIGLDLWALSRTAIACGLEGALRGEGFDPMSQDHPGEWRASFAAFLERHGHRGLNEMEPAVPNWRQDPSQVVSVVRSYLDLPEEKSPPATLERQARERLALTAELERRMNPVKRALFRKSLGWAQGWVSLRERTKSIVVRAARLFDYYVPRVGVMLVEHGAVDRQDDLFFLTDEEITRFLLAPGGGHDYRAAVARRRRELERNRYVRLPERFRGRPAPLPPDLSHAAGEVLKGIPVSPGRVTGRARVILDPRTDGPMLPGEILVAPVTDAGWTPLFALASGLVVDLGSALSHGSTVAREYGLPAVVNVRNGTTHIRTGDLVAVDGSAGTVTVLETG